MAEIAEMIFLKDQLDSAGPAGIKCPGLATSGFPFLIGFTCDKTEVVDGGNSLTEALKSYFKLSDQDAEAGKKVFAKCAVCHGVGGMFAASGTIIWSNEAP